MTHITGKYKKFEQNINLEFYFPLATNNASAYQQL